MYATVWPNTTDEPDCVDDDGTRFTPPDTLITEDNATTSDPDSARSTYEVFPPEIAQFENDTTPAVAAFGFAVHPNDPAGEAAEPSPLYSTNVTDADEPVTVFPNAS